MISNWGLRVGLGILRSFPLYFPAKEAKSNDRTYRGTLDHPEIEHMLPGEMLIQALQPEWITEPHPKFKQGHKINPELLLI